MLKKLGIAAACGIALYGLARLINRHLAVVALEPCPTPDPNALSADALEDAVVEDQTREYGDSESAPSDAHQVAEVTQVAPCL